MAQILLAICAVLVVAEIAVEGSAEATDWRGKGKCADGECRTFGNDDGKDVRASAFVQKSVAVKQIAEHRQKQEEDELQEEDSATDEGLSKVGKSSMNVSRDSWSEQYDWVRIHMGHDLHQDTTNSVKVFRKCRHWLEGAGPMPGNVLSYRQSYPSNSHHSSYWDQWTVDWYEIAESWSKRNEPQSCFGAPCANGDTGCEGHPIFQITIDGGDAAFIDYVEMSLYQKSYPWGSLRDFKWGKDGGGGWTLSTQSSDSFKKSVGTSACWEFDTWQMKTRRC